MTASKAVTVSLWRDAQHWQGRAKELRMLAEGISDLEVHDRMLQLADDYDKLAVRAQEREAQGGIK
jgi:hypothetical protein